MCIIAVKGRKAKFPSLKRVKNMCENNPDGFALVYNNGTGTKVFRSMSSAALLRAYKKMLDESDESKTSMFLHARIMTHGRAQIKNCHGWTSQITGQCFAHNGILSIANRDDMTDSETFFRDIFEPVFQQGGWKAAEAAIKAVIGTSKFVFMDTKGNLHTYGDYILDKEDNVYYSNTSYETRRFPSYFGGYPNYRLPARNTTSGNSTCGNNSFSRDCNRWLDAYIDDEYKDDKYPF